jgi:hypothetical protein
VAALTSDGFTAAALTSISSSLALRDSVCLSITGASEAASLALANSRTQRAATATGGAFSLLGDDIAGVSDLWRFL